MKNMSVHMTKYKSSKATLAFGYTSWVFNSAETDFYNLLCHREFGQFKSSSLMAKESNSILSFSQTTRWHISQNRQGLQHHCCELAGNSCYASALVEVLSSKK